MMVMMVSACLTRALHILGQLRVSLLCTGQIACLKSAGQVLQILAGDAVDLAVGLLALCLTAISIVLQQLSKRTVLLHLGRYLLCIEQTGQITIIV